MKWVLKEMYPGDMVRVPSGSFYHYGICVSENSVIQFGESIIDPNADPETIVVNEVSIDEFLKGRFAEVAEYDKGEQKRKNSPSKIILNAKMSLGRKGYHIIHNNCEHFAYECVFNEHKCEQTQGLREKFSNDFPLIDIYIADASRFKKAKKLPKYAKAEIKSCKSKELINQKRAVYGLLEYALKATYSKPLNVKNLSKDKRGKPVLKDYYISFSHTTSLICVAISKQNVGVDIEIIKEHKALDPLKTHILSQDENAKTANELLSIWTKKEAIYKLDDSIEKYIPSKINVSDYKTKTAKMSYNQQEFFVSVASSTVSNANFLLLDGKIDEYIN